MTRTDHLRVCGADYMEDDGGRQLVGSSPRVRSRLVVEYFAGVNEGIISACAEQTRTRNRAAYPTRDHLRVCGAD